MSMLEAGVCPGPTDDLSLDSWIENNNAAYNAASIKGLAGFMSKDPDLWVFQHFNRLGLFNIIYLQQQLTDLERQLDQAIPQEISGFNKCEYERLMPLIESTLSKYGISRNLR